MMSIREVIENIKLTIGIQIILSQALSRGVEQIFLSMSTLTSIYPLY